MVCMLWLTCSGLPSLCLMHLDGCAQEYEAVLDKWMAEFHYLLTYNNAALAESDPEKESVVDAVKAAVCDNIYLFIQINEDEFEKYLKTFAQDVWMELTKVSLNPGQVPLPSFFTHTLSTRIHLACSCRIGMTCTAPTI